MFDYIARKRVFIGTVYLLATLAVATPQARLYWLGLALALLGEGIRTWASGYLFKNEELAQKGPYSLVRNPLYFGSFFLGLGITFMAGQRWLILFYPLLFLPLYIGKIKIEERELENKFGELARNYFNRVPRLIPKLSNYCPPTSAWNMERVLFTHREWGNWLSLAGFAAYFYWLLVGKKLF